MLDGKATFEVDGETVDARRQEQSCSSGRSRGGRRPGTEPSSLSAPHPARRTRRSTGVRRGRFTRRFHDGLRRTAIRRRARSGPRWPRTCLTTRACIQLRASQRSRATPATTRSPTCDGPSSCSRVSARMRAETTTSPPCATTRGSSRLFAEPNSATPAQATALLSESSGATRRTVWWSSPGEAEALEDGAAVLGSVCLEITEASPALARLARWETVAR